ncbi:MAG: ribbon-helix-helix protein, CopG family [Thermoanaerobaculia bacterium]
MKKTTLYLTDDLKSAVEAIAEAERRTEADVIRDAISAAVQARTPAEPVIPLFDEELEDPTIADRVDELLEDFGR